MSNSTFVNYLKWREAQEFNCIIVIVGGAGMGKSWMGCALGEQLDNKFNSKKVIFTLAEFLDVVKRQEPCWLVFDECGLTLDRYSFWSIENRIFGHVTESFRKLGINLIMTLPSISMLSRQGLAMVHFIIDMKRRGLGRVYQNREIPIMGKRQVRILGHVWNLTPSKRLWYEYEEKKVNFLKEKSSEWAIVYKAHQLKGMNKAKRILQKSQHRQVNLPDSAYLQDV